MLNTPVFEKSYTILEGGCAGCYSQISYDMPFLAGEVTANARQEGTLPHIALPITLLPPSVQASVPSRFSKVNATLHDFTGMTQEAPDTDTLKAPLKATQGEAQVKQPAVIPSALSFLLVKMASQAHKGKPGSAQFASSIAEA